MYNQRSFINRIFSLLLVIGMFLSLSAPQSVTEAVGTPPVVVVDGTQPLSGSAPDPLTKIEPQVLDEIEANGQTDFFVWVRSKTDLAPANQLDTQEAKGEFVFSTLVEDARTSQADIVSALTQAGVNFESYYIVNRVLVHGGSLGLAIELASRPDVDQVTANHFTQIDPLEMSPAGTESVQGVGTNLSFIKVDQVWALGYTGTGIVLAGQDTGFQWDHPALINHYRGWNGVTADHNYDWWDATGTYPTAPNDGHGHGTHTTGTMVGDDGSSNQIGVAPGAKTIHCKSFTNTGSGLDANILTCFQWFLAPWDLNHNNPNPAMAPNVINNSWGFSGGNHLTFIDAINALQAAGILVDVSAGNDGSACQTLGSPGDYENVLTIGSVDYSGLTFPGNISTFSSRGPSKISPASFIPDVMAPGNIIRSSLPGSTYGNMNGTSMAAPHVAGLAALVWQAAPYLKGHIPETIAAIKAQAVPLTGQNGSNCGGNYTTGPNNDWGTGTIDAKAIIDSVSGGIINGTVTAAENGAPLEGVWITAGAYHTSTAADGTFLLNVQNGTYTVTAQKGGYAFESQAGIVVAVGGTTTVNFNLSLAGPAIVSGIVRDGTPGGHTYPLYVKITFSTLGLPPVTTFTNPFSGAYSVNLLQNTLYTATIYPTLPGYPVTTVDFVATSNPFTQNFLLQANLTTCNAPGYSNNKVFLENFDSVTAPALPSYWSVAKIGVGSTANWNTVTNSAHPSGVQPISSPNMVIFNSYSATTGHQAMLYTNTSTNLTSLTSALVSFWMYHDNGYSSSQDMVQLAVSTNGTTFYLTGPAFPRYSATPGWAYHQVDISPYAGPGKPAVYIGLFGTSGYGNDIHIEDISINSTCAKLNGGLVSGFVSSAPSGRPIISALVASTARPSELAYSMGRGENTALADGLYQLYSTDTGSQNFTATAIRHQWTEQTVSVVNDSVTRLDLTLPSAWITASPNPVTLVVPMNTSINTDLILSNTGSIPANFTIQPATSTLTSGSTSSDSFPYNEEPSNNPTDTQRETGIEKIPDPNLLENNPVPLGTDGILRIDQIPDPNLLENTPVPTGGDGILGGGPRMFGVTTPFPGTAGYRYATASCDGETFYVIGGQTGSTAVNEVWFYNPDGNTWTAKASLPAASANMRAACIDSKIYAVGGYNNGVWNNNFQIYNTLTDSWTQTTQPVTGGPMVVAYNGLLYTFGGSSSSGSLNLAHVYNPGTGLWSVLPNMPTAAAYSGAVVYKNLIFIIGGSDTADVQVYNPAGNSWDNSGPDLPGLRMDPVVGWYGDLIYLLNGGGNGSYWIAYPEGYTLNASAWPGGSWTMITPTVPNPKVAPASVCAGNRLWSVGGTVNTYEEHITQYYDGGLMCNRTFPAVPWLSAAPQSGTVPQGGSTTVTLGFNASVAPYNNPGVYHAVLKLNSDAPYVLPDIPVTMITVQTSAAVSVSPQYSTKLVHPGKYASYDYTVTNKSGVTDDFTIAALGISPGWTGVISHASFPNLPNNGSATMNIKLYPPAGAKDGDEGVVTLKVHVHDNANQAASFSSIATVIIEPASADFSASPTSGPFPLTVAFTNLSTGDFNTCLWDFGDSQTSNLCSPPNHVYQSKGVYAVSLTVSGAGGSDIETKSGYITVYVPVSADFSASPTSGPFPLEVAFTNLSTGDFDTCLWDFGDSQNSNLCSPPNHVYQSKGVYAVSLTISGTGGSDIETKTGYITVENQRLFLPVVLR